MLKPTALRISMCLLVAAAAFGQAISAPATPPLPSFDVATVKPAGTLDPQKIMSGQMRIGMKVDEAMVDIGSLSLMDLMTIAFKVKSYQISGPDWMSSERFSIQAKIPEGVKKDQVPEMLQSLLAERFKLTYHREEKEQQVYALIVGKNGPKLKESPPDPPAPAEGTPPPPPAKGETVIGTGNEQVRINRSADGQGAVVRSAGTGNMKMTMEGGMMHMAAEKMSMEAFSQMISRFVDKPVVDMTELKGNFQVALNLSMSDMMNAAKASGMGGNVMVMQHGGGPPGAGPAGDAAKMAESASDPSGGSVFQSVQALGLKLDPRKSPVQRVVVDHMEKVPTEN